jgi:hypothetical protein
MTYNVRMMKREDGMEGRREISKKDLQSPRESVELLSNESAVSISISLLEGTVGATVLPLLLWAPFCKQLLILCRCATDNFLLQAMSF